jgi:hypothetical protein
MDSSPVHSYPSLRRRGTRCVLLLCVFLCLSSQISLPLVGGYNLIALLMGSSWPGVETLLTHYAVTTLGLFFVGCLGEVSAALFRACRRDCEYLQSIEAVDEGFYVGLYYGMAVKSLVYFLRRFGFDSGSLPV